MFNLQVVKQGIETGKIRFIEKELTTVCEIGDYWFYFMSSEDENLLPEEFVAEYTIDEQAEQVFAALTDWEDYGLGEAEAEYYKAVIGRK